MVSSSSLTYSPYQQAIFAAVNGKDNLMIEAVAGSGKTTTLVDCLKLLNPMDTVLFLAFNKAIVEDLTDRVPPNVDVKTFHGLGYAAIRKDRSVKVNNFYRRDIIKDVLGREYRKGYDTANRLISLFKATMAPLEDIIEEYDLTLPKQFSISQMHSIVAVSCEVRSSIDFDDMLYQPVVQGYDFPSYDYVFVDEAQDLSPIQVSMLKLLGKPRYICVGDRHQAIYGFRGAQSDAIPELINALNCKTLPLSISYRCPSAVVEEARKLVPHIESFRDGGEVLYDPYPEYRSDDLVLCRCTVPLVRECLRCLKRGQIAHVVGQQEDLEYAWGQIEEKGWDCKSYLKGNKKLQWEDMLETLRVLLTYDSNIKRAIKDVFGGKEGVTFMTVHRSKGLEADRVFILCPELLPHPRSNDQQQERNLHYVAITRAKKQLIYVQDPQTATVPQDESVRFREDYWGQ